MSDLVFRYSFDTSSIINGRRDLMPPDVHPGVWSEIERLISEGAIRCVDAVRDELKRRDDDTFPWAKTQTGLFVSLESDIQGATTQVLDAHPKLVGVNRPGFDAAFFLAKDACHAEEVPERAA